MRKTFKNQTNAVAILPEMLHTDSNQFNSIQCQTRNDLYLVKSLEGDKKPSKPYTNVCIICKCTFPFRLSHTFSCTSWNVMTYSCYSFPYAGP